MHPVALGTDKRLFVDRVDFESVSSMTATSGTVILSYRPAIR